MSKNVIAQLEVHRDNTINNIMVSEMFIEEQKQDLLESLHRLNERKEFLKELDEAINTLKSQ